MVQLRCKLIHISQRGVSQYFIAMEASNTIIQCKYAYIFLAFLSNKMMHRIEAVPSIYSYTKASKTVQSHKTYGCHKVVNALSSIDNFRVVTIVPSIVAFVTTLRTKVVTRSCQF